ncbi:MAG TPA: pantoate--beta-alanine ligase, partial [Solirubrobacteraceae bacterium]|nr:pantoate--beta-alanine ligase [Solirubrobacteraceae bacterium]
LLDAGLEPEYLELVDADDLAPVERLDGEALLVVAARVGDVRLIDNAVLRAPIPEAPGSPHVPLPSLTEVR